MQELPERLRQKLADRKTAHALRALRQFPALIDFSSNDYLGFSGNIRIANAVNNYLLSGGETGSGGSRLLTGNHPKLVEAEEYIAKFHHAEAALFFGSGYEANSGLIATVCHRHDTIIYDELCHASLREGIRASGAKAISFAHNDLHDLQDKLQHVAGNKWVITESVFSMDGDICPLLDLVTISRSNGAMIILDEAHATGVIGKKGEGLAQSCQVQDQIFARVHTFGKAIGVQGAVVMGSRELRSALVNFCRPFIYTTAPSPMLAVAAAAAYSLLDGPCDEWQKLQELIHFADELQDVIKGEGTAIRQVMIPGNEAVRAAAEQIQHAGFLVLPVLSPTVPAGSERIRICLHAYNTKEELTALTELIKTIRQQ